MPHARMHRKLRKELGEGALMTVPLVGAKATGGRTRDYFIVGFDGKSCSYFHTFSAEGNSRGRSRSRLMGAASHLPLASIADPSDVFQYVYESETDIVVALMAGTNPAGDLFAVVVHHGDIPEQVALAVLRQTFSAFVANEGQAN